MTTTTSEISMASPKSASAILSNADLTKQEPLKRVKPAIPMKPKYIPPNPIGKLNHQKLAALTKASAKPTNQQQLTSIQKQVPAISHVGEWNNRCQDILLDDCHQSDKHRDAPEAECKQLGPNNNEDDRNGNHNNDAKRMEKIKANRSVDYSISMKVEHRLRGGRSQDVNQPAQDSIDASSGGQKKPEHQSRPKHRASLTNEMCHTKSHPVDVRIKVVPVNAVETDMSKSAVCTSLNRKHSLDISLDSSKQHLEQVLAHQQRLLADSSRENGNSRLRILLGKKQRSTSNSLDGTKLASAQTTTSSLTLGSQAHLQMSTASSSDLNISTIGAKNLQHKMLYDEVKQNCRLIQERYLIEKRPPQQHYRQLDGQSPEELVMLIKVHSFSLELLNVQCSMYAENTIQTTCFSFHIQFHKIHNHNTQTHM